MENRRKNYFIDKKFQALFIVRFCILVIIGTAISGGVLYWMTKSTVTTTFENSRLVIKSTADFILPSVLLSSVIVIISIGIATIAVMLFASHKIAGPLYRLQKDIEGISSGDLNIRFNLRKGDEIKALAGSLNAMADSLKGDIKKLKTAAADLKTAADANDIQNLKQKIKALSDILGRFKV